MPLQHLVEYFNDRIGREHRSSFRPFVQEEGKVSGLFGPIRINSFFAPLRQTLKPTVIVGHTAQIKVAHNKTQHLYANEIENLLAIKFRKQETTENVSFFRDEFQQFGFVRLSYPIQELVSLDGYLGTIRQISYPFQWLSQKISDDDKNLNRQFYIVPNVGAATTGSLVYNGVIPYIGISSYDQIPNYWTVSYITGFNKIPRDLLNLVGKLAAVNILVIAGNLVLGKPGVSTMSLGIDGLSQSLGSGISGQSGAFGGQIKQYLADIQMTLSRVQYTYKGITISTL